MVFRPSADVEMLAKVGVLSENGRAAIPVLRTGRRRAAKG
jgi:hypothetical protein